MSKPLVLTGLVMLASYFPAQFISNEYRDRAVENIPNTLLRKERESETERIRRNAYFIRSLGGLSAAYSPLPIFWGLLYPSNKRRKTEDEPRIP
jgi:hypothetical protein